MRSKIVFGVGVTHEFTLGRTSYCRYPCRRVYEDGRVEAGRMVKAMWREGGKWCTEHWFEGLTH